MKSKELKQLRKTLTKANRLDYNPIDTIDKDLLCKKLSSNDDNDVNVTITSDNNNNENNIPTTTNNNNEITIQYMPSNELTDHYPKEFEQCMEMFEDNLGELYKQSSWGLDLKSKEEELKHDKARFLLLIPTKSSTKNGEISSSLSSSLAGYAHFRFEYDDEENPTVPILYAYEIQIHIKYQRNGLGKWLMNILELIGKNAGMKKIVLTVFKSNISAMKFYTSPNLNYSIDESSPSMYDELEDYEILSKKI